MSQNIDEKFWKEIIKYHPPKSDDQRHSHLKVNYIIEDTGDKLLRVCPKCNQLDIALMKLQEARMWANAALAIHVNNPKSEGE